MDHFNDVCVILNKTTKQAFDKQSLASLTSSTKNKLYVACSRARRNLYFISHEFVEKIKNDVASL
jgi:ATP-dependent exoDNAse (exonuclease V) beta subunit